MSFTTVQINHLNRMNKAANSVGLGTKFNKLITSFGASGSYTAVLADTSASAVTLATGLGTIVGYQVQGFRSGSAITNVYVSSSASGSLIVKSGSFVNTGDVYNWIAW